MTTGKDWNKGRLNWKLCSLWKILCCHHEAINLTQNCVCLRNSCFNIFNILRLLTEFLLQYLCSEFRYQGTWTSPPAAVYFQSLV